MRYMILTYYRKANGQTDEVLAVSKNLKKSDIQTANVIIDFKKLDIVKCSMGGVQVPRDFNKIVEYYMQYYKSTIERLFKENGYQIDVIENNKPEVQSTENNPS